MKVKKRLERLLVISANLTNKETVCLEKHRDKNTKHSWYTLQMYNLHSTQNIYDEKMTNIFFYPLKWFKQNLRRFSHKHKYYVQSSKQYEKVSSFFDRKAKRHFVSNSMKIDTRAKKMSIQYLLVWPVRIFCKNNAAIIWEK